MLQGLTGWHFLIILAVILLLFGAAKLPALAKSMGQSARAFKGEMKAMKAEDATVTAPAAPEAPATAPVQPAAATVAPEPADSTTPR